MHHFRLKYRHKNTKRRVHDDSLNRNVTFGNNSSDFSNCVTKNFKYSVTVLTQLYVNVVCA